ncbi:MAG: rRNA adenine N-6-methyltransferase family protein, partial [Nitrospiria bacterium]
TAELALHIKRNSFSPPPKVDSSVVKIVPLAGPRIQTLNNPFFFKFVKASFAHRRKSIRNSLKDEGFLPADIEPVFKTLLINPQRRAETLTIEELGAVSDQLFHRLSSA